MGCISGNVPFTHLLMYFFLISEEDISLTEDELRESLQNGNITEAQVIEACQVEMEGVEEHPVMNIEGDIDGDDGLTMSLT